MSSAGKDMKFIGVRKRKWGKYVAEIRSGRRSRISLGSYFTPVAAARAYDAALLCLRGPAATSFNFPDSKTNSIVLDVVNAQGNPATSQTVRRAAIAVGLSFDRVPQIDGEEGGPSVEKMKGTNVEAEEAFIEEEETDAARLLRSPENARLEDSVPMAPLQTDSQVSMQLYDQSELFLNFIPWNTSL